MSDLVNLIVKTTNTDGVAVADSVIELNTASTTTTITSGTCGGDGKVMLTGISAGSYDVRVSGTGGWAVLSDYALKSVIPIAPGNTNISYESRKYLGSEETSLSIGGVIHHNQTIKRADGTSAGFKDNEFGLGWPVGGSGTWTLNTEYTKNSGNSFLHYQSGSTFLQKLTVKLG